jgi:hypothetical protein
MGYNSSTIMIHCISTNHPAYQRIIEMGQPVMPLIFRELEREPDHWFWALQSITGENPVKLESEVTLEIFFK